MHIKITKIRYRFLEKEVDLEKFKELGGIIEIIPQKTVKEENRLTCEDVIGMCSEKKRVYVINDNVWNLNITEIEVAILRKKVYQKVREKYDFYESREEARVARGKILEKRISKVEERIETKEKEKVELQRKLKRYRNELRNNSAMRSFIQRRRENEQQENS